MIFQLFIFKSFLSDEWKMGQVLASDLKTGVGIPTKYGCLFIIPTSREDHRVNWLPEPVIQV